MTKYLIITVYSILALLFGFLSNLAADTVIPGGNVSGTWTSAGSPYLIQGSITVQADSTLNIEPGVEVNFQGIYSLTVNGLLEAVGTETDSIHFLPADTSSFWAGIHFSDASDSSRLAFCTISHVGQMFYDLCGIICTNSNPVITHCRISDNTARLLQGANYAGGITLINSHPEISWCNIINNAGGMVAAGIYLVNSSPLINMCNISDNVGQYLGGGISITGNSSPLITNCAIERNLSNNGYGGGIYTEGGVVTISECTFSHNEAFDEGGGISIHAGSVILDHCIFEHNQCQQLGRNAGGGAYISGDTLTVDHCTFYLNLADPNDHDAGLEIQTANSAVVTISNSIFSGVWFLLRFDSSVPASVSYNDFQIAVPPTYFWGNVPPGLGDLMQTNPNGDSCDVFYNLYLEPLFVYPDTGNFYLQEGSPCIDAGDPDSPYDPDGTLADMGAFFFNQGGTGIPGGYVSGTWTSSGSPYLIQGNITVHADSTLNIEPGVEVNFQGTYNMTVNGLLEAVGTETDSIQFTTEESMCWWGIHFTNTPGNSHLAYCTVSRSGNSIVGVGAITCSNSDPIITHCRISNNQAHPEYSTYAGGIALNNSNAEISWCDINNNKSGMYGGGINIFNSSPVIAGCNISANKAVQQGGGIYIAGNSSPIITGCAIEGDTSNMYGGGITVAGGAATILDCTIGYNKTYDGGGGISISGGNVTVNRCTFAHNYCQAFSGQGGGIFINNGALTTDHCTFYGDYVLDSGGQNGMEIHTAGSASATITNNIFYSDEYLIVFYSSTPALVLYNNFLTSLLHWYFTGNTPPGLRELNQVNANGDSCDVYNNIFLDPMFLNPSGGDYHLTGVSPCIDAGDPDSPYDPDSTIADMGVFYYDQSVGIDEFDEMLPDNFLLSQNYPNPFNASTLIRYELPMQSHVAIGIFDILGRRVTTLLDEQQVAGLHQVAWNATDHPSGIYFYRIEAGEYTETKKMILMK